MFFSPEVVFGPSHNDPEGVTQREDESTLTLAKLGVTDENVEDLATNFVAELQLRFTAPDAEKLVARLLARTLPEEANDAASLLRPLLVALTVRVHPLAKMANFGLVGRLLAGLVFTYGDLISDVLVLLLYWEKGWTGFYHAALVFLVVPLLAQVFFTLVLCRQSRSDALLALVGLKPLVDSYRVWRGVAAHEVEGGGHVVGQETILMQVALRFDSAPLLCVS